MTDPSPTGLSDWELWACANEMVRRHGDDAPVQAALRSDALLEAGDLEGAKVWRLIASNAVELLSPSPTRH
ncbi:DUF6961 family protein [Sphingosinicella terrae]|uniref:DUF6961 family protein n=1 Tax=Sphingosinicella terrae TaxID=2172047 RepID=UPI000E0D8EF5|nr:hypothetical protein [Sphingosinicella terrae]